MLNDKKTREQLRDLERAILSVYEEIVVLCERETIISDDLFDIDNRLQDITRDIRMLQYSILKTEKSS